MTLHHHHVMRPLITAATLTLVFALVGCGGAGGGGSSSTIPVTVQTTEVVLSGIAEHPDGGAITVTVDGMPATVTAGTWTHTVALSGTSAAPVIRLYRNGTLVSVRQVDVSRDP